MTCNLIWNGVNSVCSSTHTTDIFLDKKYSFEHMNKHVHLLICACTHKQVHTYLHNLYQTKSHTNKHVSEVTLIYRQQLLKFRGS